MLRLVVFAKVLVCCLGVAPTNRSPLLEDRIVGGTETFINDYPYQLSFLYYSRHICGASIISANWALTAAHCSNGTNVEFILLRTSSSILERGGALHAVSRVIVHENYNSYFDYDISVLQVPTAFNLGHMAEIIPLASSTPKAGVEITITGWGFTEETGSNSLYLRVVKVPVVDYYTCKAIYVNMAYQVTKHMFCAGLPEGGKDSCTNDSGGPAVADGQLVGIQAWGYGCARPIFPGVYTDVASLRSWLAQHTGV